MSESNPPPPSPSRISLSLSNVILTLPRSPVKKKGGILAGLPRASGERSSPVPNGAAKEVSLLVYLVPLSFTIFFSFAFITLWPLSRPFPASGSKKRARAAFLR